MSDTKFKVGETYKTRDGRDARVICVDRRQGDFPIVALVTRHNQDYEDTETYTLDGSVFSSSKSKSKGDLMPPMRTVWVNFYPDGNICGGAKYHTSERSARAGVQPDAIAIAIPVEIPA